MLRIIRQAIYFIAMTLCIAPASGCNNNDSIVSVSASEFAKEIKADSVQLLDVRTPKEYAKGHIGGALNINVQSGDFKLKAQKALSKDSTILVYCRSGRRSLDAADILIKLGYKVVNLKGGIIEWKDDGFPVTTESSK
jgi:rhodanese-related sulfurtransferase